MLFASNYSKQLSKKDVVMVSTNNYIKLDKVTLANWVVKALD
jgi:hypothetical protein